MNEFEANKVAEVCTLLDSMRHRLNRPKDLLEHYEMDEESRKDAQESLNIVRTYMLRIGLGQAAECSFEIHDLLRYSVTNKLISGRLDELNRALKRDLKSHLFMHIPEDRKRWYLEPTKDWEEIIEQFPVLKNDIIESAKCYACDRCAAAVFHILLVAEFGVIQVAKLVKAEGDRPGWSCIERLEKIFDKNYKERSRLEQEHSEFLSRVMPFAHAMKDSWRHKLTHVDNKIEWIDTHFSPGIAEDIISAVRGFMRTVAAGLPT